MSKKKKHANPILEMLYKERRDSYVEALQDGRRERVNVFKSGTEYTRRGKYPRDYTED